MKNFYKSAIFVGLVMLTISGYVYSSQKLDGQKSSVQNLSPEQVNFDTMMDNWLGRNRHKIVRRMSQVRFDGMVDDWIKRRDEAQQRKDSHGHSHGDDSSHDH
jgi:hypothetical protein